MKTIWYLALKDLKILFRDRLGTFWFFGFPLLIALFFGSIFSTSRSSAASLKLAMIDEDRSFESQQFLEVLGQVPSLQLKSLPLEQAQEQVRRGELTAYLRLPKGFGQQVGFLSSNPPRLELGLDPSRRAEEGLLQGVLLESSTKFVQDQLTDPNLLKKRFDQVRADLLASKDIDPNQKKMVELIFDNLNKAMTIPDSAEGMGNLSFIPVRIESRAVYNEKVLPPSSYDITFPQAVIWGLLSVVTSFAIGLVVERRKGTLLRLRLAPLGLSQILSSKGLACFLMTMLISLVILLFGRLVFSIRIADPLQWVVAVISTSLCFTGIMMLLSTLGNSEQAVSTIGWSVLMPLSMIGGGMIPLFFMPKWMLTVSHISPIKWSITALEGAMWRGMTWQELALPCGLLIGIGVVAFSLGVLMLKRKMN